MTTALLSTKKYDFIINREGGGALKAGVDNIHRNLNDVFGNEAGQVHMIKGAEITETINGWLADHHDSDRVLMVGW